MQLSQIPLETLRTLVPLGALNGDNLKALIAKSELLELPRGTVLFKAGDADLRSLYLLEGVLGLTRKGHPERRLHAGDADARHPLTPGHPHTHTATALNACKVLSLDAKTLDIMLTWDQEASAYEVIDIADGEADEQDWMMRLLANQAFFEVPPANIHAVFTRMEPVKVRAGDVVIRQGGVGDYFYAIQSGRCEVRRETPRQADGVLLAELGPGDSFGEDALLSDAPRNATVRMLSKGELMRLAKADFVSLLTAPALEQVDVARAKALIAAGAHWLDVRLPSEYDKAHIKGARNIPLYFLRRDANQLAFDPPYVVVCDSGRRSTAGAYLLKERGFAAYVLAGGLNGLRKRD